MRSRLLVLLAVLAVAPAWYSYRVIDLGASVMVDTEVGTNDAMRGTRTLVQRLSIPVTEVREVEERRLDRLKTDALVGAVALGVGIAAAAALGGGNGPDGPGGPGNPELRASIGLGFRLPFGS